MDVKTTIENKKDMEENEKQKGMPHPLLRMQDCMLDDQLQNRKINVHNLTRLYRYEKSKLNIEKFLTCFNKVVRHHPCYLTVLHKNDDGSYVQIYRPDLFTDIKLEKMEEKKFQEEVLPKILTNFQDNLFDHLLINFRLIETEMYVYQLMDHHHVFFDGYSIKLLMDNLTKLYQDQPIIEDLYYLRLKELEEMKQGDDYKGMIKYMNDTYDLKEPCGCPKKDTDLDINKKGLDFYKFKIPKLKEKLLPIFKEDDKLYNNLIVLASMLAIAKHSGKKDIMVTWSYHGRDSLKTKYIAGNLVRLYPVRIKFKEKMKISDINEEIIKQSKDLLKKPYYPHILYSVDGEIMNDIYQKDFNKMGDFCGIKRVSVPTPPRNLDDGIFTNQVIDACYNMTEEGLEIEWQYPFNRYKRETMNSFRDLFIKYCDKLAEYWNYSKEVDLMALIEDNYKIQEEKENDKECEHSNSATKEDKLLNRKSKREKGEDIGSNKKKK